jgi:hypothetical protein
MKKRKASNQLPFGSWILSEVWVATHQVCLLGLRLKVEHQLIGQGRNYGARDRTHPEQPLVSPFAGNEGRTCAENTRR